MNILIAWDGSDGAMAAVEDLQLAGLPADAQVRVLVVADTWPQLPETSFADLDERALAPLSLASQRAHLLAAEALQEARALSQEAQLRVAGLFPPWQVESKVIGGPAAPVILSEAERWPADLVVLGSHGRSAVRRVFFGSVSQKVAVYARGSVRIGRGHADRNPGAPRLLVGFDGSPASQAVVAAVAARHWPAGTQAWIVTAVDVRLSATFPTLGDEDPLKPLEREGKLVVARLRDAGLDAVSELRDGPPTRVLIEEAQAKNADCVFVGARGHGRLERFLLGTVSASVVTRARCSVEIIRQH